MNVCDGCNWLEEMKSDLLVIGEAAHDGGVHDAVEQHGEGVDRKAPVGLVLVDQGEDLLIGGLHGLYGVLQRTQGSLR